MPILEIDEPLWPIDEDASELEMQAHQAHTAYMEMEWELCQHLGLAFELACFEDILACIDALRQLHPEWVPPDLYEKG